MGNLLSNKSFAFNIDHTHFTDMVNRQFQSLHLKTIFKEYNHSFESSVLFVDFLMAVFTDCTT